MWRRLWLIFAQTVTVCLGVALVWSWLFGNHRQEDPLEAFLTPASSSLQQKGDFSDAVKKAAPAVVNIFTRRRMPDETASELGTDWSATPEMSLKALGSGVIVSRDGYILTNYHVIEGITTLSVATREGRYLDATFVGSDRDTDLALLKVSADNLPAITFGRSENLQVGQTVLAIGNPFDVGQTVTAGIISALGRHGLGLNSYEDFIQTDAAINQGNSGGALIDANGHLIGINSAIFSPDITDSFVGIGFAIPTTIINDVLPSLMSGKTVQRGYFGFIPRQLSEELAQDLGLAVMQGVMVRRVLPNSPAEKAGLKAFDVVLRINGEKVTQANLMLQQIAHQRPGSQVPVEVLRGRVKLTLLFDVEERHINSLEREHEN